MAGSPSVARICDLVPLENRIRVVTCGSSGYRAARAYSLIRPPRTGFRRIRPRSRSATVRWPLSCLRSGTRWAMPWCRIFSAGQDRRKPGIFTDRPGGAMINDWLSPREVLHTWRVRSGRASEQQRQRAHASRAVSQKPAARHLVQRRATGRAPPEKAGPCCSAPGIQPGRRADGPPRGSARGP